MATEVKMPKLGIDMIEGSIARWLKNEGDSVKKEEPIAEVETDKSTVEMTAPADGVLVRIAVQPEELVPVGAVLAYIGEQGESLPDVEEQAPPAASANGEREAEPATGEAGETLTTEDSQQAAEGGNAKPSAAQKVEAAPTPQAAPSGTETGAAPAAATPASGEVRASPVARRLAQERGFNLTDIKGTGPGGRIVARDVEGFQTSAPAAAPAQAPAQPAAPEAAPARAATPTPAASTAPQVSGIGAAEEIPLSRMRRRISEVMTASKGPVPHFYVTMEVDMEAAMELRQQMNKTLQEEGVKISVNDLVVKAAALALKKFPNINSSFAGDKIVRHGDINVGIAVSTENGLLTIVTRNTDRMALSELSQVTRERADRARAGKLHPDDFGGSTFTVSNLGMYGVESFVAVITPPEAAILAIGGIKQEPVVKEGQVVIGQRMHATISADHRVTDGVEAAEYMVEFKRLLENPMRLML
ncbi:MAG TPA: dihydrolipoamide acetyltransferase family protein [Ardenticatenaceae bacterium]